MAIKDSILPELDHEMATTRKLLERVPDGKAEWQPHPRSMTFGKLAIHVASLPGWAVSTVKQTELDMSPPGGEKMVMPVFETTEGCLALFDQVVKEARQAISEASDEELMVPWSLKNEGHTIFTMPRAAVLRSFVMNHLIHHRGQLSVYLRLNEIPVPSIYGPSADEMN